LLAVWLTPIFTSIAATFWLDERSFSASKIIGTLLGLLGLAAIFGSGLALGEHATAEYRGADCGSVAVTQPGVGKTHRCEHTGHGGHQRRTDDSRTFITAELGDIRWKLATLNHAASQLVDNLPGCIRLGAGFNFYFYVIKRMEAGQIALITLITPVSALLLGQLLNAEKIQSGVWIGAACVLGGLLSHQWQVYRRTEECCNSKMKSAYSANAPCSSTNDQ